jgi:transcriptional regulator with XRE-family HTH domain
METNLSSRISTLRKARNLTQEALGKAVGVSAQAVSKWENGGTPDVELLPTLADALGVTIDGLFGLQESTAPDMEKLMFQHIGTAPMDHRIERLCKLIWVGAEAIIYDTLQENSVEYVKKSTTETGQWIRSVLEDDYGCLLGCPAEDMHFFTVFPEPKEGYSAYLDSPARTREFLSCLARPGRLEVLMWVYTQKPRGFLFSAKAVARSDGMSLEDVETCLADLAAHRLLSQETLADGSSEFFIYHTMAQTGLIPFLMMCRWMADEADVYVMGMHARNKPVLKTIPEAGGGNEA